MNFDKDRMVPPLIRSPSHRRCKFPKPWIFLGLVCAAIGCGGEKPANSTMAEPQAETRGDKRDDPQESEGFIVEVEISGFQNQDGKCRVAAYDSSLGFQDPSKAIARNVIPIEGKSVRWSFEWHRNQGESSPGHLAISAHHDRNENGELDKNIVGMPTEPYGFSNNPKRGYGPPKFDQVAVAPPDEASESSPWRIEITIQ